MDKKINKIIIAMIVFALIGTGFYISNWANDLTGDFKYLGKLYAFWPMLIGILLLIAVRYPVGLEGILIKREGALINYAKGTLIGVFQFLAFVLLSIVFLVNKVVPNPNISIGMILLFFIAFVGQTAFEEVTSKGIIRDAISRRSNKLAGVIASSLFFSALHIPNGDTTVLSLLNIFLVGVVFSLLAIGSGSLFTSCGAHLAWNFFESNIFTASNSNNLIESGIFKLLPLSSSNFLTGGSFGPEASVITTIIGLVSIILCLYFYKIKLSDLLGKSS